MCSKRLDQMSRQISSHLQISSLIYNTCLKLVPNPLPGSNVFLKYNLPCCIEISFVKREFIGLIFVENTLEPLCTSENLFVITQRPDQ